MVERRWRDARWEEKGDLAARESAPVDARREHLMVTEPADSRSPILSVVMPGPAVSVCVGRTIPEEVATIRSDGARAEQRS